MLKFDWNILWTLINLVFFFLLMKFFLFKPIQKVLDKRQEIIDQQFKEAADAQSQAEEKVADYERKIANADQEASQIVASAKADAKAEYNKIMDRASADAADMKKEAQKQIDAEIASARRSVQEDIASLAMQAAEKVVGANVNDAVNSSIIDEFLNESSES